MATTLYLIRHGVTEWNKKKKYCGRINVPLSNQGKRQAAKLAKRLTSVEFDKIYSSNKKRAIQTAGIVFKNKGITLVKELQEVNFGVMEGLTYRQILKKYPEDYKKWIKNPYRCCMPQAESLNVFRKRVKKAIAQIIKINRGKTIAVVCHGGAISVFITAILKNKKFWGYIPEPTSITIVEYENNKPHVELFNSIEHFT